MVEAFVGLVGGGKSYSSVKRMCNYIASGGVVVTNILFSGYDPDTEKFSDDAPIFQYLANRYNWQYQPGQYKYISFDEMTSLPAWFKRVPGGSSREKRTFLCIDEATDLFDTLDRGKLANDSAYRELFRFLRLSRHAHIDVLFVCQDLNAINSRLRGLVSFIWRSTDMKNFRIGGLRLALPVNCFLLQQFDRTGKFELRREFVAKEQRVFDLFQSEAFHDSMGITFSEPVKDGKIKGEKKKMNFFHKVLLFLSLAIALLCLMLLNRLNKRLSSFEVQLKKIPPAIGSFQNSSISKNVDILDSTKETSKDQNQIFEKPRRNVVRGEFDFVGTNSGNYCYIDGNLFRVGLITEYGICKVVQKNFVLCVDGLIETVILPRIGRASSVSFQAVPADPGGASL